MTETILLDVAKVGGPIAIALVVIWLIIKLFMANLKDMQKMFIEFIGKQEASFKDTIDNHLNEAKKVSADQTRASCDLKTAVNELLTFLRYQNGRDRRKDKE